MAALSADPVTLAELEAACGRFARPVPGRPFFANLSAGLCDEPHDAGVVVIDLVARLVVVDSTYSSPGPAGEVCYHDGQGGTDKWLPYHLADDWLLTSDHGRWPALAEQRRRERVARPPLDARRVFYGRPLLEFVARETFAAYARRETIAAGVRARWTEEARRRLAKEADVSPEEVDPRRLTDEEIRPRAWPGQERHASEFYDALKEIHAAWLLTPRDDLGGRCPRDVALERHDHLMWDLQDQCERWTLLGECPPGLDPSSFAFRFGGFGTHELVQYYDLVRALLWSCWERLVEMEEARPESLTPGDFLASEVARLEGVRDEWLETSDPECHGRTPRSVIDRERARLPEGMSGHDAMVDPGCPCCQMLADLPGPAFWSLDGSNMDDDFAFDIHHRTREEWEEEQRRWEEDARRFDAERAERRRLGLADAGPGGAGDSSVWSSSFSAGDAADVPPSVRLFGIGAHLGELADDLPGGADGPSAGPEVQRFIDELNRDFGNLRELLQASEPSLAEALISPVIDRFGEALVLLARKLALNSSSLSAWFHGHQRTEFVARFRAEDTSRRGGGPAGTFGEVPGVDGRPRPAPGRRSLGIGLGRGRFGFAVLNPSRNQLVGDGVLSVVRKGDIGCQGAGRRPRLALTGGRTRMDWITDQVAVGNYLEAQDAALLKQHAFRSVVSLDGTLTARHATEFGLAEVASYRLIDGAGNDPRLVRLAIDDLTRLARTQAPVLVQCHAGRSRSAIVVAGYLMRARGVGPEDALAAVAARREINVTPGLLDMLHTLET